MREPLLMLALALTWQEMLVGDEENPAKVKLATKREQIQ